MTAFEFCSASRILFGYAQFARLGELARGFGKTALVVTGAGDRHKKLLQASGVRVIRAAQSGEPTVADVDRITDRARSEACESVIGIGGGSAIDAAKAVAGLLTNGGSAADYMEVVGAGRKIERPAAPWIAVPTTAGTGAEVTRNAVVGSREPGRQFKASIRSEHLLPRIALVDPELTLTLPPEVTARTGMDALCQLIESYTSRKAGPLTDGLALEGLARAGRGLLNAWRDGTDRQAREDMALAALLSGIALTHAGLGAVHGFAAPLGANFPIPHGTICANLLAGVMAANVRALRDESTEHPALGRYARIGRTLTNQLGLGDTEAIDAGVEYVSNLVRQLGVPPLSDHGLTQAAIPKMVSLARRSNSIRYNPVELSDEQLADVLAHTL